MIVKQPFDFSKMNGETLSQLKTQVNSEIAKRFRESHTDFSFDSAPIRTQKIEDFIAKKVKKEKETKKVIASFSKEDQAKITTFSDLYKYSEKSNKEMADKMWALVVEVFAKNNAEKKAASYKKHI